jgi:type IV secretory pathway protease TraF
MRLNGSSMEPMYHDGGINFCWTPSFWFSKPKRGGVVMVKLAGKKIMFLKRIVALEDEAIEFWDGKILVNGNTAIPWRESILK